MPSSLSQADQPLARLHDVALLDLDGVVYLGPQAVTHAPESLVEARRLGMRLAFVTNNAARPPVEVAEHLSDLGIPAVPGEVVTSSQAAAHYLADLLPAGSRVLVIGTTGLLEALTERGLVPVSGADDDPAAVVQGHSPRVDWAMLAEGAVAIRRDLPWVATNLDPTVPSPRGPLPGNGSLVAALRHATGREPVATGKPDPTMHRESVQRSGAQRPIVVGDRLDTDIEGANAAGCPSLLVLTGVTAPLDVALASPELRPSYLAADLRGLLTTHPGVHLVEGTARCGGWVAELDGSDIVLSRTGGGSQTQEDTGSDGEQADDLDPLRAVCVVAWSALDSGTTAIRFRAAGADASAELERLTLA